MKQINFTLTVAFVIFSFNITLGCLNGETKILKNGTLFYVDREGKVPYGHEFFTPEDEFRNELRALDSLYKVTKDLDYLSDKGLLLILLKQFNKAINLYLDIEKIQPNRYSTASNIGTAYELDGQNENALKWINKAIEIDSTSHNNSEWIHSKILDAKIKGEQYFTSNYILSINFGNEETPVSILTEEELTKFSDALYFQLNERVSFIKPQEKIIAQLLFELGNIEFLLGHYDNAIGNYVLAKKYGFEGHLIESRIMQGKKSKQESKSTPIQSENHFLEITTAGIVIVLLLVFIYRRKTNKTAIESQQ
ncbi:MAG: hypothetical protein ABI663_08605 [Chryseolinea sp.]